MKTSHTTQEVSRRSFIRTGALAGATLAALPNILTSSAFGATRRPPPSGRVNIGIIGTGNQGTNDMKNLLKDERVQVVAVCDVNRESAGYWNGAVAGREPAKKIVETHYAANAASGSYKGCTVYEDFRELLARPDIDAVHIATPDHWHCIPVLMAAKAGKDIYCQKPLSLTISEGRAMANAVKKYGRVFQCGSQQRSDANFRHACELVRNGRIGKLIRVGCSLPPGRPDFGKTGDRKKPEPVPEGFNYNMWLGPAPEAPYAPARCHVNFRWIYDYSGGQVTDWGGHHPDIAQWGMDTELTGPVEIRNPKAEFEPDELWNTATKYHFEAVYKNGVVLTVQDSTENGVVFEGTEGVVFVTRGKASTLPQNLWSSVIGPKEKHLYVSDNHFRNFVDCVFSRKPTIAPCEVAHRSITIAHLGNISMRLGRNIKWDPKKEQIIGDAEASKMLKREYRAPWTMNV